MRQPVMHAAALVCVLLAACLTACGANDAESPTTSAPRPSGSKQEQSEGPAATEPGTEPGTPREDPMQIRIDVAGQQVTATLADSAAARDLLAQLPVTIDMVDHGGVEKTGPLPRPLSLAGQPDGADPDVGDLGYYAPGTDLVLYYGDQSYYPGIVVLGRLDEGAADRIAALSGAVTVTVTTMENS